MRQYLAAFRGAKRPRRVGRLNGRLLRHPPAQISLPILSVPTLVLPLTLLVSGHFSRVPKADLEKAQAETVQYQQINERLRKEGTFYLDQVQTYRKKFPKSASCFPKYVAPAAPMQTP